MEKPDYVKNFQPPEGTSLRKIGNNWYLYGKPSSVVDPETGKRKTVAGAYLGKVTPDGLVPPKRGRKSGQEASGMNNVQAGSEDPASQAKKGETSAARQAKGAVREESGHPSAPAAAPKGRTAKSRAAGREKEPAIDFPSFWAWKCDRDDVDDRGRIYVPGRVRAGAFVLLHQNTKKLRAILRKHFPDHWEDLYVAALMRLVYGTNMELYAENYKESILPAMYPETRESVLDFLDWLKIFDEMRSQITGFMKEFVASGIDADRDRDEEDPVNSIVDSKDCSDSGDSLPFEDRHSPVRFLVYESRYVDPSPGKRDLDADPDADPDDDPDDDEDREDEWEDDWEDEWEDDWEDERTLRLRSFPRVLQVYDMRDLSCPRYYFKCRFDSTCIEEMEELFSESGLKPEECVFWLGELASRELDPRELREKNINVVCLIPRGTHFDRSDIPSLTDNDDAFIVNSPRWNEDGRVVAVREKDEAPEDEGASGGGERRGGGNGPDRWRHLFFFDLDLLERDACIVINHTSFTRRTNMRSLAFELKERGQGRVWMSDETLEELRFQVGPMGPILAAHPWMGTLEIATNIRGLKPQEVYGIFLRVEVVGRQAAFLRNWRVQQEKWMSMSADEGWHFVDQIAMLVLRAVFPYKVRKALEALDSDPGHALHSLDLHKASVEKSPRWIFVGGWKREILGNLLNFRPLEIDLLSLVRQCRRESGLQDSAF